MYPQYISDEDENKNPFIEHSAESTSSSIADFINDGDVSEATWTPKSKEKVRNYSNFSALICNQMCSNMILTFLIFEKQRSSSSSSSNIGFTGENYEKKEVNTLSKKVIQFLHTYVYFSYQKCTRRLSYTDSSSSSYDPGEGPSGIQEENVKKVSIIKILLEK